MRTFIVLFLKGFLIGLSAITPGLTAATTAFILGSYSQILQALKSLNFKAASYLFKGRLRELSEHVEWKLLLLLPLGAACAIYALPLFVPLSFWQDQFKPLIYAFVCGAILAGLAFTLWDHRGGGFFGVLLFVGGVAASVTLLLIPITPLPGSWQYLALHGIVAVFTDAVPGLANCFTDRPLADYNAVAYYANHDFLPAVILFALGVVIGIILLVSLMMLAYRKASEKLLSLLMGLTAGVIIQLWPLRYLRHNSEQEITLVIACFIGGMAFSAMLQFMQRRTLA